MGLRSGGFLMTSAERMRRHRALKKRGAVQVTVIVEDSQRELFVDHGLLDPDQDAEGDRAAIAAAAQMSLDEWSAQRGWVGKACDAVTFSDNPVCYSSHEDSETESAA